MSLAPLQCPAFSASGLPCQSILGQFPDDFFALTPAGRILFANRNDPQLRLANPFRENLRMADRERFDAAFAECLAGRAAHLSAMVFQPSEGPQQVWNLRLSPINTLGAIAAVLVVVQDRTALVAAEAAARESTNATESIISSSPVPIVVTDLDDRVVLWSPAAEALLGWGSKEVLGKTAPQLLLDGPEGGAYHQARDEAVRSGAFVQRRAFRLSKAGERIPVDVHFSAWIDANGAPLGLVRILVDLREKQAAEKTAKEAQVSREEVQRLKSLTSSQLAFLSGAAHELANPATTIRLQRATITRKLAERHDPDLQRSFELLSRNLDQLQVIVDDVLDATRIQRHGLKLAVTAIPTAHLIDRLTANFAPTAHSKGLAWHVTPEADVTEIRADETRLMQVLGNLVRNAIRFTPAGGAIHVAFSQEGPRHRISVRDTGVGLEPEQIGQLFQPFSQVHAEAEFKNDGSGLGLYISKGLIEAHGGSIECVSPGRGKGTEFIVRLPAQA